jgi:glycosyltransferase involved in cell wall biosynthesis
MSDPEVSVVIPTRNRSELLPTVLAAVLGQEDVALEAIVIDDGSTDDTPALLAALAEPRLRVLRNDVNAGVARARNRGIAEARGTWVAFIDDDDLWAPGKLRTQLDAVAGAGAGGDEPAVLAYAGAVAIDEQRRVHRVLPAPPNADSMRWHLLGGNWIGSPSGVMVRTDAARAVGGFDERLSITADWDLWLRLVEVGRAVQCPELLVGYTEHDHNMHLDMDTVIRELFYLRRKHRPLRALAGRGIGSKMWWRWVAAGYRRAGRRFRAAAIYLLIALRFRSPRSLRFAAGMLVGERLLRLGPDFPQYETTTSPDWLERYRSGTAGIDREPERVG